MLVINSNPLRKDEDIMNWKDAPSLFANGKFRFRSKILANELSKPLEVISYYPLSDGGKFYLNGESDNGDVWVQDLVLIARPIEDMTDEEIEKADETIPYLGTGIDGDIEQLMKHIISEPYSMMCKETFLYLLSIGVYPFSDTEDVIFKPKN